MGVSPVRRVCSRARVLGCPSTRLGEVGREALVEQLDRDVHGGSKRLGEAFRLERLLTALAAQRQRQPDDDSLGLLS